MSRDYDFEDIILDNYTPEERHKLDALRHGLELERKGRPLLPETLTNIMRRYWARKLSGQDPDG